MQELNSQWFDSHGRGPHSLPSAFDQRDQLDLERILQHRNLQLERLAKTHQRIENFKPISKTFRPVWRRLLAKINAVKYVFGDFNDCLRNMRTRNVTSNFTDMLKEIVSITNDLDSPQPADAIPVLRPEDHIWIHKGEVSSSNITFVRIKVPRLKLGLRFSLSVKNGAGESADAELLVCCGLERPSVQGAAWSTAQRRPGGPRVIALTRHSEGFSPGMMTVGVLGLSGNSKFLLKIELLQNKASGRPSRHNTPRERMRQKLHALQTDGELRYGLRERVSGIITSRLSRSKKQPITQNQTSLSSTRAWCPPASDRPSKQAAEPPTLAPHSPPVPSPVGGD